MITTRDLKEERARRALAREINDQSRSIGRLLAPETGGFYLPMQSYGTAHLNAISINATVLICPIHRLVQLQAMFVSAYVATTNNGSNYWTIKLMGDVSGQIATVSTAAITVATWTRLKSTAFSTNPVSADNILYVDVAKTGTPGNLSIAPAFYAL